MQDNNLGGFLTGFLVGAAVSALLTPQSGEKTREKLKTFAEDKLSSFQESIEDRRDQLKEELERIEDEIKSRAQEATSGARRNNTKRGQ